MPHDAQITSGSQAAMHSFNPHTRTASHRTSALIGLVLSALTVAAMWANPSAENGQLLRLMFYVCAGFCVLGCLGVWMRAVDDQRRLIRQTQVIALLEAPVVVLGIVHGFF